MYASPRGRRPDEWHPAPGRRGWLFRNLAGASAPAISREWVGQQDRAGGLTQDGPSDRARVRAKRDRRITTPDHQQVGGTAGFDQGVGRVGVSSVNLDRHVGRLRPSMSNTPWISTVALLAHSSSSVRLITMASQGLGKLQACNTWSVAPRLAASAAAARETCWQRSGMSTPTVTVPGASRGAGGDQPEGTATTGTRACAASPLATDRVTSRLMRDRSRCWMTTILAPAAASTRVGTTPPTRSSLVAGTPAGARSRACSRAAFSASRPARSGSVSAPAPLPSPVSRCTTWTRCTPQPTRTASSAATVSDARSDHARGQRQSAWGSARSSLLP